MRPLGTVRPFSQQFTPFAHMLRANAANQSKDNIIMMRIPLIQMSLTRFFILSLRVANRNVCGSMCGINAHIGNQMPCDGMPNRTMIDLITLQ